MKKKNIVSYIVFYIIVLFGIAIIEISIMLFLDQNRHIFSGIQHSFKGEIWFSVVATILAAVPGTFCGILALIQTQRLHVMEDWFRHPILIMRKAKLGLLLCGNPYFRNERYTVKEREYFDKVKESFGPGSGNEGILSLDLQFELQSEPVIHKIEIESIRFVFPNVEKSGEFLFNLDNISPEIKKMGGDRYTFHSRYEDGKVCYMISSDIYADRIFGNKEFWNAVSGFMDYANEPRARYRVMNTKVRLKVYHKYALRDYDILLVNIYWKANTKNTRKETYMEQVSIECVCSYMNKKELEIILHEKRTGKQKK